MSMRKLTMAIETTARDFVDERIASGEVSYAADGGDFPTRDLGPREIFERLISRNPYS